MLHNLLSYEFLIYNVNRRESLAPHPFHPVLGGFVVVLASSNQGHSVAVCPIVLHNLHMHLPGGWGTIHSVQNSIVGSDTSLGCFNLGQSLNSCPFFPHNLQGHGPGCLGYLHSEHFLDFLSFSFSLNFLQFFLSFKDSLCFFIFLIIPT